MWVILLGTLLASAYVSLRASDSEWKLRLAAYFSTYNAGCIVLRMVMPTREMAQALNWMDAPLRLAAMIANPVMASFRFPNEFALIAVRATATLALSTLIWIALGWVIGGFLDDRTRTEG